MNDQVKLEEGVHNPLVSPEFTGTDEEIMAAFNYWTRLVNIVRELTTTVTGYPNKEAILAHLERETSLLRTELENVSAVPVAGEQPGVTQMKQPLQGPDAQQQADIAAGEELPAHEKVVDLSLAAESIADRARRAAGISKKVDPLERAFKNMEPSPIFEQPKVELTPEQIETATLTQTALARKLAGLPAKRP